MDEALPRSKKLIQSVLWILLPIAFLQILRVLTEKPFSFEIFVHQCAFIVGIGILYAGLNFRRGLLANFTGIFVLFLFGALTILYWINPGYSDRLGNCRCRVRAFVLHE